MSGAAPASPRAARGHLGAHAGDRRGARLLLRGVVRRDQGPRLQPTGRRLPAGAGDPALRAQATVTLGETLAPTGYQLRPDTPVTFGDGRVAKYLNPQNAPQRARRAPEHARATQRRRRAASDHGGRDQGRRGSERWARRDLARRRRRLDAQGRRLAGLGRLRTAEGSAGAARLRQRRDDERACTALSFASGTSSDAAVRASRSSASARRGRPRKTGLDDFLAVHRGSTHPIGLLLEHAVEPRGRPRW